MPAWGWFACATLVGGAARWGVGAASSRLLGAEFPYGTLIVNLAGCLAIGAVDALSQDRLRLGPEARLALATGFCGAFTTFSALIMETEHLLRGGQLLRAGANLGVSVLLGLLCFRAGWALARLASVP
ncbi:MAG: CrcB family protein [Elusimicrobia bacterium]|nr:CrcB family protein [Elusimicrobiota bacterium]